jgi:ATP-dependent DNA ligase
VLPLPVDYAPMEAQLVAELPRGPLWQYEPKFDGFRCIAFKDGAAIDLRSKAGQPFNRYFPEVVTALGNLRARSCVLDGELVVPRGEALAFDDLLLRIHPAQSRVQKLARECPALYVLFDLLVDERGHALIEQPLSERRRALEHFFKAHASRGSLLRLAPCTTDEKRVADWMKALGAGLDGIMAKRFDLKYRSGERTGMQKWKRLRSADCVVGGFRYAAKEKVVGSLLLGLYNEAGLLDHVGFTANISKEAKPALTRELEQIVAEPGFTGQKPGGPSRWSSERSTEWRPLAPRLVAEVQYDHFSGGRFRHGTRFLRWRPDKAPQQCTLAQVMLESVSTLHLLGS